MATVVSLPKSVVASSRSVSVDVTGAHWFRANNSAKITKKVVDFILVSEWLQIVSQSVIYEQLGDDSCKAIKVYNAIMHRAPG